MSKKDGGMGDISEIPEIPACIPRINPFVHRKSEWDDPVDKLKTVILSIILLPFRTVCIMVLLVLAWALAHIGLYGLSREELTSKPLTGWRKTLKFIVARIAILMYLFGGLGIATKGRKASRRVAPILVTAPHSSFLDGLIIHVTLCSPLVREEDMNLGKLIDYTQPIYVCREDPDSRQKTIQGIIERANSKEEWSQILIFPEGTCTNRSSLIQFKPGAFYPGVPIQPVLLRYPNKMDTVTWTWEGPDVITLLWRTMTQFHTFCEIEYLPVYVPNEEEKHNPKLFAKNVQHLMAKALNIPVSDYTFDDCKLMNYAKIMTLPYASAMADLDKMRLRLGLVESNIEEKLVATKTFEPGNSWVQLFEFAELLQVEVNSCTVTLFNLFNKKQNSDNRDIIDFREYLLCTLFLITLGSPKINFIKVLFQLNANKDGQVSREAFHNSVKYSLLKLNPEKIDLLFINIDEDNLGFITFDKFHTYTKKLKEFSRLYGPSEHEKLRH